MTRIIPLVAMLALAACAADSRGLAETETALTAAERAALAYVTLPLCPAKPLCSDPAITARIKAADDVAYASVVAARSGASLDTARAAVATLVAAVPLTK